MKLKNVGSISNSIIKLNNINIFYGENGGGKTYTSYIIYGILKYIANIHWEDKINDLPKNIMQIDGNITVNWNTLHKLLAEDIINDINENSKKIISIIFKKNESEMDFELNEEDIDFFTNWLAISSIPKGGMAKREDANYSYLITHEIDNENIIFSQNQMPSYIPDYLQDTEPFSELKSLLLNNVQNMDEELFYQEVKKYISNLINHMSPTELYIPAERQGINIFYDNLVRGYFYSNHRFSIESTEEADVYSQPLPILDYINYISIVKEQEKKNHDNELSSYMKNILKGEYKISSNGDVIFITENNTEISMELSSSVVKSLFGLHTLDSNTNSIIIIDEPELNLTPKNQKLIAEYLYSLNEKGNKIIISTHSDYIIKTFAVCSLKEHVNKKKNNIQTFYFNGNNIHSDGALWKLDEIPIFDNTYDQLINEFTFLETKLDGPDEA